MSVDVDIYMSNIIKFFKENPKDLMNLIPKHQEDSFYEKIRIVAYQNYEKGIDVNLTKKQMIDICRELNESKNSKKETDLMFLDTKFGRICLN